MKKRVMVGLAAILLFATMPFAQDLGNGKLIAHANGSVRWTQCAFGPDSTLWVVWVPGTSNPNSGGPIYVAAFDGTNTTTPVNVTDSDYVQANRPHIAVSTTGDVLVTWGTISNNSTLPGFMTTGRKPGVRSKPSLTEMLIGNPAARSISTAISMSSPMFMPPGGRSPGPKSTALWEDVYPLAQGYGEMSAIALDVPGSVHAILIEKQDSGDYQLYYTSRTNDTMWYTREPIPGQWGSAALPWIAVGPNNIPVAVWMDYGDTVEEGGTNDPGDEHSIRGSVANRLGLLYAAFPPGRRRQ